MIITRSYIKQASYITVGFKSLTLSLLFWVFLLTASLCVPSKATAEDIVVTNLNNLGPGSLREAILKGNASSEVSINITFQTGLTGPLIL